MCTSTKRSCTPVLNLNCATVGDIEYQNYDGVSLMSPPLRHCRNGGLVRKKMSLSQGDRIDMKVLSENRVLVLSSLLALVMVWVAGCAGMAEPLPTLSVAPSTLSVSTKVGTSNTVPVSVINTGTTPVTVSQVIVNGTGFTVSGATTPMTLAANKTASFNVSFAPMNTGSVSGTVKLVTDSAHRPAMLPLNGSGSNTTPMVSTVQVSPEVSNLAPGGTIKFAALIQGATANSAVNWSTTIGTITTSGVFTAPMAGGVGRVTAQSVADPTFSASAMVAVAGSNPGSTSPLGGSGSTSTSCAKNLRCRWKNSIRSEKCW